MGKNTEARLRRIFQIQTLKRLVSQHVKQWVVELDSQQRAKGEILSQICRSLARELDKLRVLAGNADLATFADAAGSMAVLARRQRAVDLKVRQMKEGLAELHALLDQALEQTMSAEFGRPRKPAS
ncbi:MAG: hypothetical protein ACREMR_00910 [Gemmatimonadales bacterium]